MKRVLLVLLAVLVVPGFSSAVSRKNALGRRPQSVVVNSLADDATPAAGTVTLRSALAAVPPRGTITFDRSLDGGTIHLSAIAEEHTPLPAEVYDGMKFAGLADRDYGRSALFVQKNVTIDARALPHGITLAWSGSEATPARVLAVYGDLAISNVTITGGRSAGEALTGGTQPFTMARGAGLAVSGTLTMTGCTVTGNRVDGDTVASRDRGSFGGGVFAFRVVVDSSVIAGNVVTGFGAAGGGLYSVGLPAAASSITRTAITGNRIVGEHAYGGGVFSEGGGPGEMQRLVITDCTIARNVVLDNDAIPELPMFQYYYRGGGVYISNGSLVISSSTIVENSVTGIPATFSGKPNLGGGGVAATIGNAHVVEEIQLWHSIVAGNTLNGVAEDVFTGSLLFFSSFGYNRVGRIDFSQMLVPVPAWQCLSRRHWPKVGDREGVTLAEVVDAAGAERHASAVSEGTDAGGNAVLWYLPAGDAIDAVPRRVYDVPVVTAGYTNVPGETDRFLDAITAALRARFGSDFGPDLDGYTGTTFDPIAVTWPASPTNAAWISYWRKLDVDLAGRLGSAGLNDEFWSALRVSSSATGVDLAVVTTSHRTRGIAVDQRNVVRSAGTGLDIGAIER